MWMMAVSGDAESIESRADGSAFGDFYRLELDAHVRRAVLLLGSNDIANDVVHDAFIAVYRRWETLEEPRPYLHMAVLNGCRGIHCQRSRQRRLLPRFVDRGSSVAAAGHDAVGVV
jgi:DNA-directed RNA polymerase specialized sigma24 family protein